MLNRQRIKLTGHLTCGAHMSGAHPSSQPCCRTSFVVRSAPASATLLPPASSAVRSTPTRAQEPRLRRRWARGSCRKHAPPPLHAPTTVHHHHRRGTLEMRRRSTSSCPFGAVRRWSSAAAAPARPSKTEQRQSSPTAAPARLSGAEQRRSSSAAAPARQSEVERRRSTPATAPACPSWAELQQSSPVQGAAAAGLARSPVRTPLPAAASRPRRALAESGRRGEEGASGRLGRAQPWHGRTKIGA